MNVRRQVINQFRRALSILQRQRTMEELFQKAVKRNEEMKKPSNSVPWKPDQPHPQPYYTYNSSKKSWDKAECKPLQQANSAPGINRLALFSWNIDFMLPFAKERMNAALDHLDGVTSKLPSTTAAVIFLQECLVEDLATIGEKGWVRDKFNVTDVDNSNWQSGYYGTTTLVDRRLDVTSCFRVHYEKTRMERDALFVDVLLGNKTIRLCNTHLESLALEPPFRPAQMQVVAKYLHEDGVDGALVAGDFNAIQPFDRTLHSDNNLKDAYLELGGKEDSDEGYTWGQQAATEFRRRFGCSRMDKVYFTGKLKLHRFERFGADIQVSGKKEAEKLIALDFEKPWITDHLGVVAEVEVDES
ncbi:Endonuclease/exonuclease/phosphatase [Hypoxylon sp. FL0890]|nr:Endonuclease/exonuclease/phosphatase [Hypoxylon sp. FL0890]